MHVQLVDGLTAENNLVVVICTQWEINWHWVMCLCLPDTKWSHWAFTAGPIWDHWVGFYRNSWVALFVRRLCSIVQISIIALVTIFIVRLNGCWQQALWTLSLFSLAAIQCTEQWIWSFGKLLFDLHLNTFVWLVKLRFSLKSCLLFSNDVICLIDILLRFRRPTTVLLRCRGLSDCKVLLTCLCLMSNWSKVADSCVVIIFREVLAYTWIVAIIVMIFWRLSVCKVLQADLGRDIMTHHDRHVSTSRSTSSILQCFVGHPYIINMKSIVLSLIRIQRWLPYYHLFSFSNCTHVLL